LGLLHHPPSSVVYDAVVGSSAQDVDMPRNTRAVFLKPLSELLSLSGRRALITGSASGIGEAIAYSFAEAGADLELADMDEAGLRSVREELSRFNVETNIHRVDLLKKEDRHALWRTLERRDPDILVNNAGIYPFRDFLEMDENFLQSHGGQPELRLLALPAHDKEKTEQRRSHHKCELHRGDLAFCRGAGSLQY